MHSIALVLAGVMLTGSLAPLPVEPTISTNYEDNQAAADLEIVLQRRGAEYTQAHARLTANPDITVSQISRRLATPALPAADEARLWSLLAEVAPPGQVADIRARLRPVVTPRPAPRSLLPDPRMDPQWARRDRALSKGVLATGILFGLAVVGVILTAAIPPALEPARPPGDPPPPCIDCYPFGLLLGLAVVPIAAIPITVVASVRGKHRRPLRAYQASLTGAGLRLRF